MRDARGSGPYDPVGATVVEIDETTSTNDHALRLAMAGAPLPFWLRADRQTAGRGRNGRTWATLPGNLSASLVVEPGCGLPQAAHLAFVAAVAAHDALLRLAAPHDLPALRLKWPNDILMADRKLGGILTESSTIRDRGVFVVVVGVGLNLAACPPDPARPATSLAAHGVAVAPAAAMSALASAMVRWTDVWQAGRGFAAVREAWLLRAGAVGERIAVNTGRGRVEGRFAGLGEDGALVLREIDGGERLITFGDVTLLGDTE